MAVLTFTQLANQYDPAIATGVNTMIATGIAGNAENVADALTMYVVIIGGLLAFREMTYPRFVTHALRAACISALMTAGAFNTLIAGPAMNTIPAWISQTVNAQAGVTSAPQQFDLIWSATKHQEAAILQQAAGIENTGYRIEAALYTGAAGFLLTVCFWCYEFSRAIMGLLVATLPFVLFLYLFDATRGIPMRVFHKGVGVLILQLLLAITIQLMLRGNAYILMTAAQNGAGDLDAQLGAFEDILVFFAFGTGMIILIPSIAAYIGGGIALAVAPALVSMAISSVTRIGGAASAAGRAGSRLINRARA